MRKGLVGTLATALALTAAVAGCGGGAGTDDAGRGLVIEGTPPAKPYDGPLAVPVKETSDGGEDDPRRLRDASGAAGRAVECDGEMYGGGISDPWSKGDGGSTPEEGLKLYLDIEQPDVPRSGYRVEREEGDRVLYSFDVKGETKVAVVVAEDRPGWGPETSASCDPAELPASYTDSKEYEIWTDARGRRVPVTRMSSSAGPEHCDWQSAHFLHLGEGREKRMYVRDPRGVFPPEEFSTRYDGDAVLPPEARDTGYRQGERALFRTPDASRVYIRTPRGVELWPAPRQGFGCA
ncbi:hypothetical protein GCM10010387_65550 [Streptomyces inusitatus]|uniref:Lipoprotein n=1 Tax=Streptomyces inusitatus TaxID=68221 RepID=A0A918V317_9ACTN|nr:hypothetical protein [Streptomyces inusitatus]GGZ63054.1 hypothetical protein GCM10010387_65550 [Streptomyces inusitatus]